MMRRNHPDEDGGKHLSQGKGGVKVLSQGWSSQVNDRRESWGRWSTTRKVDNGHLVELVEPCEKPLGFCAARQ